MKVKILTHTPEHLIGESAKVCYSSKLISEGGKDITHQLVHKQEHLAVLRFAYAIVSVEDISVAAQNQLVRSKHLDFLVESKRYVKASKGGFKFIYPKGLSAVQTKQMKAHWERTLLLYNELLDSGLKAEDARAVLPANTSTNLRISGNLQAFNDFLKLRVSPHAQLEIREMAVLLWGVLIEIYPNVFSTMVYDKKTYDEWVNQF